MKFSKFLLYRKNPAVPRMVVAKGEGTRFEHHLLRHEVHRLSAEAPTTIQHAVAQVLCRLDTRGQAQPPAPYNPTVQPTQTAI